MCRLLYAFILTALPMTAFAQIDEICHETGTIPSLDSPFAHVPYIYGRISLHGFDTGKKPPRVTVSLSDGQQPSKRYVVNDSGNYCFRRSSGGGGIVIEVDGVEVARRSLPAIGAPQIREDFEIYASELQRSGRPATVSAKVTRPANEKTVDLYKSVVSAEESGNNEIVISLLKQIVILDPIDHVAWTKLGAARLRAEELGEAEQAFRKALELNIEYLPAWINVGVLRMRQRQFDSAIEILKHAAELDPTSARVFQLLGESYLNVRKGTLGVEALNKAISLDPIGMAECHLRIAHLYELAGANHLATREYRLFLSKVPSHRDRRRMEKFIRENPEK